MTEIKYFDLANKDYYEIMFDFKCKNDFFSDYLKYNALPDKTDGLGTTHLFLQVVDNVPKTVLGFYTLKNASLVLKELEDGGERIGYPAVEISQFAVHEDFERKGIGRIMIDDIIAKVDDLKEMSAISHIVLCSVSDSIGFYEKMKFESINKQEMFIPRENWNKKCIPMAKKIVVEDVYKYKRIS